MSTRISEASRIISEERGEERELTTRDMRRESVKRSEEAIDGVLFFFGYRVREKQSALFLSGSGMRCKFRVKRIGCFGGKELTRVSER